MSRAPFTQQINRAWTQESRSRLPTIRVGRDVTAHALEDRAISVGNLPCEREGLFSLVMAGPTVALFVRFGPHAHLERDNMVRNRIRARSAQDGAQEEAEVDRRKFIKAAAAGTAAIATAVTRANAQRYSVPIIDTHVHLYDPTRPQGVPWPSPEQASIYRTFLPADYRRIAEPFGVVGMIETECSPWVEDNYWVLDVSAKETIVVGEIGDLFPGKPDFGEHLSRLHKNPLYRGIRFAYLWGRDVAEEIQKPQVMADLRLLSDAGLTPGLGRQPKGCPEPAANHRPNPCPPDCD